MADSPPNSMVFEEVSEEQFPDKPTAADKPVRICAEEGCNKPCKKRGRGYAGWCDEHLFNHLGDKPPKSREIVTIDRSKIAAKAEAQSAILLGFAQKTFLLRGDQYCAYMIGAKGEDISKNIGAVAADFKWMAKVIDKSDKYFALAMLTMNLGELALAIACHHEVIPWAGPVKHLVPKPPPKVETNGQVIHGNFQPTNPSS